MKWLESWKKLAGPLAGVATGAAALSGHVQPDFAVIVATGVGQAVEGTVDRPREAVRKDEVNRERRAKAYEDFGGAIASLWASAGICLTFRPKFVGYAHGMAALVRAQRTFQEQHVAVVSSLHSVLLYGSTETQKAALQVFRTVGAKLTEASAAGKPGSEAVKKRLTELSGEVGDAVVEWRRSAQADLSAAS